MRFVCALAFVFYSIMSVIEWVSCIFTIVVVFCCHWSPEFACSLYFLPEKNAYNLFRSCLFRFEFRIVCTACIHLECWVFSWNEYEIRDSGVFFFVHRKPEIAFPIRIANCIVLFARQSIYFCSATQWFPLISVLVWKMLKIHLKMIPKTYRWILSV